MRWGFSSNAGIDVVVTALAYLGAVLLSLMIREYARARVGNVVGDRTPRMAGRMNPDRSIFDPLGSIMFPIFTAVTGAVSYGWTVPLSYDLVNPGPVRRTVISAVSGSGANLLVALAAARILSPLTQSIFAARLLGIFVTANVTVAVMHLLPVPPLDGARIVSAFLSPQARASYLRIEPYGIAIMFGIAFISRWVGNQPFDSIIDSVRGLIA